MIVREISDSFWLFDQADHSLLCGEISRQWGRTPFDPAPVYVQEAAATHDAGWKEWDERPRLDDETGRPHTYSRMQGDDYRQIWERGLRLGWMRGDEIGLLVSLHATRFFAHKQNDADRQLLEGERRRQREALAGLGFDRADEAALPEPYATWHDWMFFWDALSLFLCEGWPSPWQRSIPSAPAAPAREVEAHRYESSGGPSGSLHLDPNPFRSAFDLSVAARVIPARYYESQAELDTAIAAAERKTVLWNVLASAPVV